MIKLLSERQSNRQKAPLVYHAPVAYTHLTSGITGYSTKTYKQITEHGKTTEVLANSSTYSKRDEVVYVERCIRDIGITVEVDGSAQRNDKVGNVAVDVVIICTVQCNRNSRCRRLGAECGKVRRSGVLHAFEVVLAADDACQTKLRRCV